MNEIKIIQRIQSCYSDYESYNFFIYFLKFLQQIIINPIYKKGQFTNLLSMALFLLPFLVVCTFAAFDIMQFGAIPNSDNVKDHFQNQKAITQALLAANASNIDRVVRIPAKTFYSMPFKIQNMKDIKLQILGRLSASKNVKYWPRQTDTKFHWNFIQINNCNNIQLSGGGKIDGRGYHWWMILFLDDKKYIINEDDRPHLINMVNCQYIKVHDLILKNSPQFHLKMDHCHDAQIYNIDIKVNTTAQINLLKHLSLQGLMIMFPFNTDGIDPSGGRMHIHNLTVQNWDDVVVPKPSPDSDCTRDMLIEDIEVRLGVGLTIGSVPPQINGDCIRNITFRNVQMSRPLKGIYVKTNPGDQGYGNISNIYYKNFTMDRPIWWAIYIGPQQMKQPDGDGPGCMLYPFDKKGTCQTQPRVTLRNITLEDVKINKSLLYPYTIRCNVTNPCTQINFINVETNEWQIGQKILGYVCQFASGKGINNIPPIHCLDDSSSQNLQSEKEQQQESDYDKAMEQMQNMIKSLKSRKLSPKKMFQQLIEMGKDKLFNRNSGKYVLARVVEQIQKAAKQVKYHDSHDDQFMYNISQLEAQFNDKRTLEEILNQTN